MLHCRRWMIGSLLKLRTLLLKSDGKGPSNKRGCKSLVLPSKSGPILINPLKSSKTLP